MVEKDSVKCGVQDEGFKVGEAIYMWLCGDKARNY